MKERSESDYRARELSWPELPSDYVAPPAKKPPSVTSLVVFVALLVPTWLWLWGGWGWVQSWGQPDPVKAELAGYPFLGCLYAIDMDVKPRMDSVLADEWETASQHCEDKYANADQLKRELRDKRDAIKADMDCGTQAGAVFRDPGDLTHGQMEKKWESDLHDCGVVRQWRLDQAYDETSEHAGLMSMQLECADKWQDGGFLDKKAVFLGCIHDYESAQGVWVNVDGVRFSKR